MANATIKTSISNITDNQAATTSVSIDGTPNTVSSIITNRTFTPKNNFKFTKQPVVSFAKTSNPNNYNSTVAKNLDGSHSFTIKYLHTTSTTPTTDVIEFFGEAKTNVNAVESKVLGFNIDQSDIKTHGESRTLKVTGNPNSKLKIKVTQNPNISPISNAVDLVKEFTAVIGNDGVYTTVISFPQTTLATGYRVILTEFTSGTFGGSLKESPTTIFLKQWPYQQTKLEIIESGDTTWGLPSAGVNSSFFYYSGTRGSSSLEQEFAFTCTHSANITADGTFTVDDFTQVTGQSSTLTEDTIVSAVSYKNVTTTIDNAVSPKSAVISGKITIRHGYDAGGHTLITLNVNDILNHA